MRKILTIVTLLGVFFQATAQVVIKSPDGRLLVKVACDAGRLFYQVSNRSEPVIAASVLGLKSSFGDFSDGLTLGSSTEAGQVKQQYSMIYGKKRNVAFRENRTTIRVVNREGKQLEIDFRVTNDAVAFQYRLAGKEQAGITVREELTQYHFPENTVSWLQPMQEAKTGWEQTNPAYEEHYRCAVPVTAVSDPKNTGWVYPALFQTGNNWVAITEAGMDGTYCATRLLSHPGTATFSVGFPGPREVFPGKGYLPAGDLPFASPWRVITVGGLKTIMESTAGTDFAGDVVPGDFSFIRPGKASWSWINSKDDYIVYDEQKKYIDFAAAMHWQYCLIDVNWDREIGYDKIRELADYGKAKNVGLLLWYNSAGDWNTVQYTPRNLLLTRESRRQEFARLRDMGIKGVKIDFFGGDGQSVMAYYVDILKDAADFKLMVNFHGATLPRGWARTFPNLLTAEAIRGFENVTFSQGEADREAEICTVAPFARNLFDPMDYTPMNLYKVSGNIHRKTSSAFELALSVIFLSGIQHYAESPEGMNHVPGFVQDFLRQLPDAWEDIRFLDGYPGKYLVLARKSAGKWYIAGINSERSVNPLTINTRALGKKMTIITNGDDQLTFSSTTGRTKTGQKIALQPLGGFVMVVE